MAGRTFTTTVSINGEVDASVQRAFAGMADRLGAVQRAAIQTAGATDRLTAVLDKQSDELEKAKKAYTDYILGSEKSRKKTKELANNIRKLAGELDDNEKKLLDAREAAEKLAGGFGEAGDAAKGSEGGFTVMKGAIANLLAQGVAALITGCVEAAKSIYGLAESTREYREDMNKLETAFSAANHSAELAGATYSALYGVIGETDQSVEAAQQIALLAKTEQDAAKWADLAAGVVGRFGDALQPETFFESANETLKLGEATGAYTQMLEGAGYNVEEFNEYLAKCNTEAEKQAYMLEVSDKILGDASDTYREANKSIIEARDAQSEFTDITAQMGEKIEPVTTAVQRGLNKILQKGLELMNKVDLAAFADKISSAFEQMAPVIGEVMERGFEIGGQLIQSIVPLLPPLLSLIGQLGGFLGDIIPIVGRILAVIVPLVAHLIEGLTPAVMTVLNALTPVISAVASILEWLLPPLMSLLDMLIPIIQRVADHFSYYLTNALNIVMPIIQSVIGIFSSLIDFVRNIFLGNWSAAWESFKGIFRNAFAALSGLAKAPLNAVIAIINRAIQGINKIGFEIPDWVPIVGGKDFSVNIPEIPMLATGGFTSGVSIAGEAGTEAVISFDQRYRAQNLSYWAQAGQMLGADPADYTLGASGGGTNINLGGVTFAPSITVSGNADKESIMKAIEEEYPEFLDMLEEYFMQRSVTAYA